MSSAEKKMCKWDKAKIQKDFKAFSAAVGDADFACLKCGRAASSRKCLCKPEKRLDSNPHRGAPDSP